MNSRKIIKSLYEDIWAFQIPRHDDLRVRSAKSSSLYGEITSGSLEKLIQYLRIKSDDVFYDLGSGVGKVVMQVALNSPVKKAIGIELSETRFNHAQDVRRQAIKQKLIAAARIKFRNADVLSTNLNNATIIYTCSTAFPERFMKPLGSKLAKLKSNPTIVTLQELPDCDLSLIDSLKLDMTWARRVPLYVYKRRP